jgi:uncharacterized protein YwgA
MTIDVPSLIQAAGGEVVGKIRLQKLIYLLDQKGLNSGFNFDYHHYGPYSEELADQVEDDVIFSRIESASRRRQSDGVPYIAYRANSAGAGDRIDEHLSLNVIRSALSEMQHRSATILEIAATINWLAVVEGRTDWRSELIRRKGAKAQNGRDGEALELLHALQLPPAV